MDAPDPNPPETWQRSSLWADALGVPEATPLVADREVGVAVVGGGIAGLVTAALLAEAGADVLVLERHDLGGVATRNTTAKASALQGTTLRAVNQSRGEEATAHYAAAQLDALDGLRRLIARLGIECHLTTADDHTYATEADAEATARETYEVALAAGLPVEWVTDLELPFPVLGAVRLAGQAHFDPGLLCAGLARHLGPARLASHTAVADVDEGRDGCTIVTDAGHRVTAEHVVIATQSPVVDPALLASRVSPSQSYCIAARLAGAVPTGMYISCDSSTRSLRPAIDGDDVVAVIGGEGHHMGEATATAERWDRLAGWARQHFGGDVEVTHRWATHDLSATDHVPYIGRLAPGAHRRWVAAAFAKWGMTNAYVAARLISAGIAGDDELAWAATFDSTRLGSTVTSELASAAKTAASHLVGDRLKGDRAPRCTHQGCVLKPDDALGTWDCPCHGSRFAADGTVIQGPASRALAADGT